MALIKLGNGITDIRGSIAGNIFKRDRSGLHIHARYRRVHKRTIAQDRQRKAFVTARNFSHNNRQVSYNIYRALNKLAPKTAPLDYYPDMK